MEWYELREMWENEILKYKINNICVLNEIIAISCMPLDMIGIVLLAIVVLVMQKYK